MGGGGWMSGMKDEEKKRARCDAHAIGAFVQAPAAPSHAAHATDASSPPPFRTFSVLQEQQRRAAYAADVTYVTNSELGFDYLRDNLAQVCP